MIPYNIPLKEQTTCSYTHSVYGHLGYLWGFCAIIVNSTMNTLVHVIWYTYMSTSILDYAQKWNLEP
jgi:hypothetical protein